MVLFNYSTKELTAKVVYYGPGLCGKTTNLQYVHANLPGNVKGKMLSLATKTDRTLFFDFLPLDLGTIRGMKTRIQLYTVPGQVFYNETRKLVLKGADGIVFVADSQEQMLQANVESFRNLEENLKAHGMNLAEMPHVLQFNKRDLPRIASIEDMNARINKFNAPFYESVATTGIGVQDTLKAITKLVLLHLTRKYDPKTSRAAGASPVASPPPAATPTLPVAADSVGVPLSEPGAPASPDPGATVPLQTAAPKAVPPPPPNFHGPEPTASEPEAPTFDSEEVDAFMDDVAPPSGDRAAPADPVLSPFPSPTMDAEDEAEPDVAEIEMPDTGSADPDDRPVVPADEPTDVDAVPLAAAPDDDGSGFEVDGSFDPDWNAHDAGGGLQTAATSSGSDAEVPPGVSGLDEPAGETAYEVDVDEADDAPIELTEAADDRSLFEDPGLDVAKLAAGHAKEIVVPVELGDGADVRRFKLSVTLRLDPVD